MQEDIIRRTAEAASEYFRQLPADQLDPEENVFYKNCPCGVGAHLAHLLAEKTNCWEGADALGRIIGGNRAHAVILLRGAGSPHDPFGPLAWPTPPDHVFAQMAQARELPDLHYADLADVDFFEADLSDADLRGCRLTGACFEGALLCGAQLREADLRGATMRRTQFISIDARRADFRGTDGVEATFHKANLRDTDLRGAELKRCSFTLADLSGADFRGSNLYGADFTGANLQDTDFRSAKTPFTQQTT